MTWLREWIYSLIIASVIAALAKEITPPGGVKRVTEFLCGVMLTGVMLMPVVRADWDAFSLGLADYRDTLESVTESVEEQENRLLRVYIEQEINAYVLQETSLLEISDAKVTTRLKWRDESWIPYEVTVAAEMTDEQWKRLGAYLESELGIPPERQHRGE